MARRRRTTTSENSGGMLKKLGGIILTAFMAAALVAGPAYASEPAANAPVCEDWFSQAVCDLIGEAGGPVQIVREIAENPPGGDDIRRTVQHVVECILYQTCIAPTPVAPRGSNSLACREVLSDRVCDQLEDPVGLAQQVYEQFLQCYLDPDCTPTPAICTARFCITRP